MHVPRRPDLRLIFFACQRYAWPCVRLKGGMMPRRSPTRFLFLAAVFLSAVFGQTPPSEQAQVALTLRNAVDIALAPDGSERVALAAQLVEQTRYQGRQSRAALLPQVASTVTQLSTMRNLEALGVRLATPIPGLSLPRVVGPFNVFDARLTAGQSVFDLSAIRRYQASRQATGAARTQERATRDEVTADIVRAYLSAQRARDQLAVAEADVELAEALAKLAASRKDAGAGTGIEVTRAQVQLANERQNRLLRRQQLHAHQLRLLRLIGLDLSTGLRLTTRLEQTAPAPVPLDQALEDAFANREDWKAARQRLESLRLSDSSVRWERLPSATAFADYGTIGSSVSNAQPTRAYGAALNVPLFDGGRRSARRGESASKLRAEEIRVADLQRQIELELRLASDALESSEAQLQVGEQGERLAENELEQARRRYRAGVGSSIETTDAQTRLARARQNRLNALYAFNLARVDWSEAGGRIAAVIP